MKLCKCGCGKEVTREGNRYLIGHSQRGKVGPMRGKTHSEETIEKIRGREPWNKGKTHSEETIEKMRVVKLGKKCSKETIEKIRASNLGREPWNKGKTQSPEHIAALTYSLKKWEEKCPLLSKVEEMKEDSTGKICGHCTNHNCKNSKELVGWFNVSGGQIHERCRALNDGNDNNCFYCSDQCKRTCIKYGKRAVSLIKADEIAAGIRKEDSIPIYTSIEYNTWREEVLKRQKEELGCNECEYCGNRNVDELVVHHEKPQKTHPLLALDPDNGIVACGANSEKKCHYKYGHKIGTKCSTGKLASLICH